jgi:hypothetical protein
VSAELETLPISELFRIGLCRRGNLRNSGSEAWHVALAWDPKGMEGEGVGGGKGVDFANAVTFSGLARDIPPDPARWPQD